MESHTRSRVVGAWWPPRGTWHGASAFCRAAGRQVRCELSSIRAYARMCWSFPSVNSCAQEMLSGLATYLGDEGTEVSIDWRDDAAVAVAPAAAPREAGAAEDERAWRCRAAGRTLPRTTDRTGRVPRVQASKTLSWALRHGARELGLTMCADGFVRVDDLLRALRPQLGVAFSESDVREIVAEDAKRRYTLSSDALGATLIRAANGHSLAVVEDEALLIPVVDPAAAGDCVHGTYLAVWPSIARTGLSRMVRTTVPLVLTV